MRPVRVHLGDRSYTITIGRGALRALPAGLKKLIPSGQIAVVTNRTIHRLYYKKMAGLLKPFNPSWIILPDGERYKNLDTVQTIYERLIRAGLTRKAGLIALGGGVVGDMGGFAAATYLRGIPYIQIPTTLLSQVDSSVGGKTGVDLKAGKNLVGAFHQPSWVLIDTDFLSTLPRREFLCGMSEVVKYGVLWDRAFFGFIEKNLGKILALHHNTLESLIRRSCEIKAHIVSKDEKEEGLRSLLNLGHTMGHAVETLSGYNRIRHGEAVSMGIAYAAELSVTRGLCPGAEAKRIQNLLKALELPTRLPRYPKPAYARAIRSDKKSTGAKLRYIALKRIGKAIPLPLTPEEITRCLP